MKNRHNEGFSLVETLVSITILALIVIPVCSGLIMSFRMNAKTNSLMQAQLAVSSAAETLLAEGIDESVVCTKIQNFNTYQEDEDPFELTYEDSTGRFPGVSVYVTVIPLRYFVAASDLNSYTQTFDCYTVRIVSSVDDSVCVTTQICQKGA